jgi:putative transposase
MEKNNEIGTGGHCVFNMHVHLVFVPRYRKKVLDGKAIEILRESFAGICRKSAAELIEMNGEEDHVHLLVFYPPKVAVSALVNSLKGASSRILKKRYPGIAERYYKNVLWSPSYFAASCGGAPISIIRHYVEQQQTPENS